MLELIATKSFQPWKFFFWIVCISVLVGFGTGVIAGYLLAFGTTSGQTGCPDRIDSAMETEVLSSSSYEFEG